MDGVTFPKRLTSLVLKADDCAGFIITHMWSMLTRDYSIGTLIMTGVEEFYWT